MYIIVNKFIFPYTTNTKDCIEMKQDNLMDTKLRHSVQFLPALLYNLSFLLYHILTNYFIKGNKICNVVHIMPFCN